MNVHEQLLETSFAAIWDSEGDMSSACCWGSLGALDLDRLILLHSVAWKKKFAALIKVEVGNLASEKADKLGSEIVSSGWKVKKKTQCCKESRFLTFDSFYFYYCSNKACQPQQAHPRHLLEMSSTEMETNRAICMDRRGDGPYLISLEQKGCFMILTKVCYYCYFNYGHYYSGIYYWYHYYYYCYYYYHRNIVLNHWLHQTIVSNALFRMALESRVPSHVTQVANLQNKFVEKYQVDFSEKIHHVSWYLDTIACKGREASKQEINVILVNATKVQPNNFWNLKSDINFPVRQKKTLNFLWHYHTFWGVLQIRGFQSSNHIFWTHSGIGKIMNLHNFAVHLVSTKVYGRKWFSNIWSKHTLQYYWPRRLKWGWAYCWGSKYPFVQCRELSERAIPHCIVKCIVFN